MHFKNGGRIPLCHDRRCHDRRWQEKEPSFIKLDRPWASSTSSTTSIASTWVRETLEWDVKQQKDIFFQKIPYLCFSPEGSKALNKTLTTSMAVRFSEPESAFPLNIHNFGSIIHIFKMKKDQNVTISITCLAKFDKAPFLHRTHNSLLSNQTSFLLSR